MSRIVTVNGTEYVLNEQSDQEPWGVDQSDLIQALVDVANATVSPGDILPTSFSILNNVVAVTNVSGLQFDITTILSSIISYTIHRSSATEDFTEAGTLTLTYRPDLSTFNIAQQYGGDNAGITFSITPSGQFQYLSTNMNATGYSGSIRFSAKSSLQ